MPSGASAIAEQPIAPKRPLVVPARVFVYPVNRGFNIKGVELQAFSVEVIEEEWKHNVAIVKVRPREAHRARIRHMQPIKISWGGIGKKGTFYGYVHNSEYESETGSRYFAITAVGTTYRFRMRRNKVWEDFSATHPMHTLAKQHLFSAFSQSKQLRRFKRVLQTTKMTDWEFLVDIAKRSGCTLYSKGTTLYMYRRDDVPTVLFRSPPVFSIASRHIRRFAMIEGLDTVNTPSTRFSGTGGALGTSVSGVFTDSNGLTRTAVIASPQADSYVKFDKVAFKDKYQVPSAVQTYLGNRPQVPTVGRDDFSPFVDDITATSWTPESFNEMVDEMKAHMRLNSRPYKARVRLVGDQRVHQGMYVYLDGLIRGSGLWYVEKVHHQITSQRYYMDCILSKETVTTSGGSNTGRPFPVWVQPTLPLVPVDPPNSLSPPPVFDSPSPDDPLPPDPTIIVLPIIPTDPSRETSPGQEPLVVDPEFSIPPAAPEYGALPVDNAALTYRAPTCPVQPAPFSSTGEWRSRIVNVVQIIDEDA